MTEKQRRFAEEYLVDMNAAEAARRAGYKGKSTGSHLLGELEVRRAVEDGIRRRAERSVVRQENVLRELAEVAFGEASDESGARVKFASKLRALELLGKHLGIFERRPEEQEQAVIVDDLKEEEETGEEIAGGA